MVVFIWMPITCGELGWSSFDRVLGIQPHNYRIESTDRYVPGIHNSHNFNKTIHQEGNSLKPKK